MDFSPTVTARISGLRRAPLHVVQGTSRMYFSRWVRMVSLVVSWYLSKSTLRTPGKGVNQLVSRPSRVWYWTRIFFSPRPASRVSCAFLGRSFQGVWSLTPMCSHTAERIWGQ